MYEYIKPEVMLLVLKYIHFGLWLKENLVFFCFCFDFQTVICC